jgi:hypothetical protein
VTAGPRAYFLVKDPHWTFVWWGLPAALLAALGPEEPLWLRVHDVTDIVFDGTNSHHHFDIRVGRLTDHWYLRLDVPNRVYCAEIGHKVGGVFVPLVRSNAAVLPPDAPCAQTGETWVRR